MNKLAIPTILLATVMVAGIFAFMPVEQASTVHAGATGILGETTELRQFFEDELLMTAACNNDLITIDANTPFRILSIQAANGDVDPGTVGFDEILVDGATFNTGSSFPEGVVGPSEIFITQAREGVAASDNIQTRIDDGAASCNDATLDLTIMIEIASNAANPTVSVVAG